MIYNVSKGKAIAEQVRLAESFFARLKGLMFEKEIAQGSALVIKPCYSLHSFFMNFPIDVAFVGERGKVLKILRDFKPWRISSPVFGSKFVIEMMAGAMSDENVTLGDVVEIRMESRKK